MDIIDNELLVDSFNDIGISLRESQIDLFNEYYNLLIEKNRVMNLTRITDYRDVVIKHFVDSASIILLQDSNLHQLLSDGCSVIDVGTGAGFPGIPLKILFPEIRLTLLDSLNKRISFLQELCSELGFYDITFVHSRSEDAAHDKSFREQYDICVSRAVASLSTLLEYCLPFVRRNGYFISYKSEKADSEISSCKVAFSELRGKLLLEKKFVLPDINQSRTLLLINKTGNTPKKYPRKAGTPSKNPL